MPEKPTYEELEQRVRELEASKTVQEQISLDRLIDNIQAGVVVHGSDGAVIKSNTAAQRMLGLTHDQMLEKELSDPAWTFLREDGSPMPVEEYPASQVLKTKKPLNVIAGIAHSEKAEPIWVLDTAIPELDENGDISQIITTFMDISSLKEAERMKNEREEWFRSLFENMFSGVAIYEATDNGEDFVIREFNRAAESIEHVEREKILGRHVSDVFPGVYDFGIFDVFQRVWKNGKTEYHEPHVYIDESGSATWRETWVYKLSGGEIVAIYNDVTDKINIEAALIASEKMYHAVVEDQAEIISRFKSDGTFLFVNDAYCQFFGKRKEELIGNRWQPVVYEDDLASVEQKVKSISLQNPLVVIENRVWDKHDRIRWMQFVNRGFFNTEGQLLEIQSVGRDITELKQKEDQLRQTQADLSDRSKQLEQVNAALEVLLERRNRQIVGFKERMYRNFSQTVLPDLELIQNRLKVETNRKAISLIIQNMQHLLFPDAPDLASSKYGLTKTEIKIASMIKNGMTSLEIVEYLNISPNTVAFHRKSIRKKLGLVGSTANLKEYLSSQVPS